MTRFFNCWTIWLMTRCDSDEHTDKRFKFLTHSASSYYENVKLMICQYTRMSVIHDWFVISPKNICNQSMHRILWYALILLNLKGSKFDSSSKNWLVINNILWNWKNFLHTMDNKQIWISYARGKATFSSLLRGDVIRERSRSTGAVRETVLESSCSCRFCILWCLYYCLLSKFLICCDFFSHSQYILILYIQLLLIF